MKIVSPSFEIMSPVGADMLKGVELAGRTCYKSEDRISEWSAKEFVGMLIRKGHESVLEHEKITVRFVCDRGVSHEIVRHRLASFSQESTRYCNYGSDKFGRELTFIRPFSTTKKGEESRIESEIVWDSAMMAAERAYLDLLDCGWSAQQARSVLPNSLKTEIVVTANLREWRTIFRQRTSAAAHPQMRELMCPLLDELKKRIPVVFDDITY